MKRKYIIREHSDFVKAAVDGGFVRTDFFVLQARENLKFSHPRVGVTASKKVGNAVVRNRSKRRLRALADLLIPWNIPNIDYVFIARSGLYRADWNCLVQAAQKAVRDVLKRIHK